MYILIMFGWETMCLFFKLDLNNTTPTLTFCKKIIHTHSVGTTNTINLRYVVYPERRLFAFRILAITQQYTNCTVYTTLVGWIVYSFIISKQHKLPASKRRGVALMVLGWWLRTIPTYRLGGL